MSIENEIKKLTEAVTGLTQVLATAAIGGTAPAEKTVKATVQEVAEVRKTAPVKEEEPVAAPTDEPVAEETVAEVPTGKYADAAKCTVDEIRARLTPVVQKHGPSAIEGPLKGLGVEMLTKLPAEKYPELLEGVAAAIGEEV